MEKWSRGYAFTKILVFYTFWLSHKRIRILGKENIPKNKPVIFAPNHQNALMDPLAVLLTNKTQPVWLARADIFKVKATRPILRFLKIIPVYRIRDGKENLHHNEKTFSTAIKVLENKQVMALFPEAAHTGKRQMITHKKAIPRIAFLTEEKNNFKLRLQIIPVGIYYDHYWNFNRSVLVNYGTPIDVSDYEKAFRENEYTATKALRDEIYNAILPLTLNIKSREFYNAYELIRKLAGKSYAKNKKYNEDQFVNRFFSDKKLVADLEKFEKQDFETFKNMVSEVNSFFEETDRLGIDGEHIEKIKITDYVLVVFKILFGLLSLPLFLPGFIFNGFQFLFPRRLVHKKVKDPIFKSTFNMVIGLLLFPFSHLIFSVIVGFIFQSFFMALFLFLILPLWGKLSYQLFEYYNTIFIQLKLMCFWLLRKRMMEKLVRKKKELKDKIIDAASNNSVIFET